MSKTSLSWPEISLHEICRPTQWPTIPQTALVDSGYTVYGANGKIGYYTEFNHEKPTVLITCRGATCGTLNVSEPKSYVTGNAMALDDLQESMVTREYLVYALRRVGLAKAISGTAQPQITRQGLTAISIPLPPLPEQRRIAAILDKAGDLRGKRRASFDKLDKLAQCIFLDLFGDPATNPRQWPGTRLGEETDQITDGEHITPQRTSKGVKLLSARNIRDGYLDFGEVDYVSLEEHERIKKRCNPTLGDVLVSCSGTIGRVATIETDEPFSLVRSVALIRPKKASLNSKFLENYLRTPALKARMLQRANASSQANLFQNQIRDLPLFLPPIKLQAEFNQRVVAVDRLKAAYRVSLAEIDALFSSLQHRAFRGEL